MPIFMAARKQKNPVLDVKLRVDKLYINKQLFTTETLHLLPAHLQPEALFTKEVDGKVFFYTKNSPFSNHYPSTFQSGGFQYSCAEQFYMAKKAEAFDDVGSAQAIRSTTEPHRIKSIGSQVKGYDLKIWRSRQQDVMKEALRLKFQQNPDLKAKLLATRKAILVEAAPKDLFWGGGISIHDEAKLADPVVPGKNILGKLLMQVREELLT